MPRWCRSSSAPFQLQAAVEQRCDLPQSVDTDTYRGELDRQGNAIKLAANLGQHVCVVIGKIGAMTCGRGPLHEQPHRWITQRLAHTQSRSPGWCLQRHKLKNLLTLHQQRLPAGRKDADVGCPLVDIFRKRRDDVDHVLAAVEDEKETTIAQKGDDAVGGIGVMNHKAERRSDAAGHECRVP